MPQETKYLSTDPYAGLTESGDTLPFQVEPSRGGFRRIVDEPGQFAKNALRGLAMAVPKTIVGVGGMLNAVGNPARQAELGQTLLRDYRDLAQRPGERFFEDPVGTALAVAGPVKGLGGLMRVGGVPGAGVVSRVGGAIDPLAQMGKLVPVPSGESMTRLARRSMQSALKPSQRAQQVEPGVDIVDAALKTGLDLRPAKVAEYLNRNVQLYQDKLAKLQAGEEAGQQIAMGPAVRKGYAAANRMNNPGVPVSAMRQAAERMQEIATHPLHRVPKMSRPRGKPAEVIEPSGTPLPPDKTLPASTAPPRGLLTGDTEPIVTSAGVSRQIGWKPGTIGLRQADEMARRLYQEGKALFDESHGLVTPKQAAVGATARAIRRQMPEDVQAINRELSPRIAVERSAFPAVRRIENRALIPATALVGMTSGALLSALGATGQSRIGGASLPGLLFGAGATLLNAPTRAADIGRAAYRLAPTMGQRAAGVNQLFGSMWAPATMPDEDAMRDALLKQLEQQSQTTSTERP